MKIENEHEADSDNETIHAMKERHRSEKNKAAAYENESDDETLYAKKKRKR
jgi:hypothetical protein